MTETLPIPASSTIPIVHALNWAWLEKERDSAMNTLASSKRTRRADGRYGFFLYSPKADTSWRGALDSAAAGGGEKIAIAVWTKIGSILTTDAIDVIRRRLEHQPACYSHVGKFDALTAWPTQTQVQPADVASVEMIAVRASHWPHLPGETPEAVAATIGEAGRINPPVVWRPDQDAIDRRTVLGRLDIGRDGKALFLPPASSEFGWTVMDWIRVVHFNTAAEKIVCCRRGEEVLYPSASAFDYAWQDSVPDELRCGTGPRQKWPELLSRYPDAAPVYPGLSTAQEFIPIALGQPIQFSPKRRGLRVDACLGVRHRGFLPQKNWGHWQFIADELRQRGLTFAIIGSRETSHPLDGMACMSADYRDIDAAIELLQGCRVFAGTDSGAAHLASVVSDAPMVVQAVPHLTSWTLNSWVHRMKATNPNLTELAAENWDSPQPMLDAILSAISHRTT